jgi:hypothetical protein
MSAISEHRSFVRDEKDFRVVFASTVWTTLSLIAAVLLSRRLAGAFGTIQSAALPCVAGTVATFLSLAAHALWSIANPTASGRNLAIAAALTILPPLMIGDVLWTSPSVFIAGYLAALFVLAALATLFVRDFVPRDSENAERVKGLSSSSVASKPAAGPIPPISPRSIDPPAMEDVALPFDETIDDESCDEADPALSQSIIRRQPIEGAEIVEGTVRIHFGPGERTAVAHVAFVPPLAHRPRAECQVLSDFDGRVRVGLSQAYGLRIEARRSEPAEEVGDVLVGFSADARAAKSEAA